MDLTLHVWRQKNPKDGGRLEEFTIPNACPDTRFLELLDELNGRLLAEGKRPIAFEHGCREGVCGVCGFMINGVPHGSRLGTAVCQLFVKDLTSGEPLTLEPFRSRALPVVRDLVVNRRALDRIQQAGGFINAGSPTAGGGWVPGVSFCIECGACIAACPNGSANLFVAAKMLNLARIHQSREDRSRRAARMVARMDAEGFGACTNHRECEASCPKGMSADLIALMNREYLLTAAQAVKRKSVGD